MNEIQFLLPHLNLNRNLPNKANFWFNGIFNNFLNNEKKYVKSSYRD